jgi:hypothetical protein
MHRRKGTTKGALLAAPSSLEDKIPVMNQIVRPHHMSNSWLPWPNNMSAMPAVKPAQPKTNCLAFLVFLYITGDVAWNLVNVNAAHNFCALNDA